MGSAKGDGSSTKDHAGSLSLAQPRALVSASVLFAIKMTSLPRRERFLFRVSATKLSK